MPTKNARFGLFMVICFLVLTLQPACKNSGSNSLPYYSYEVNLDEGQRWESNLQIDLNIDSEVFGQSLQYVLGLDMDYDIKALSANEGDNRLSITSGSTSMHMKMDPMGSYQYNSDSTVEKGSENAEMFDFMNDYVGKTVELEMDSRGRIKSIEGEDIDQTVQQITDSLDGLPDFRELLGEDLMKKFSSFFAVLPPDSVQVGDSWETELLSSIYVFPLLVRNTFTLTEVGSKTSTIALESRILLNEEELLEDGRSIRFPIGDVQGDLILRIRGTQTGTLEVENQSGWTVNSLVEQQLEGEIQYGIMTLPMVISNTIKYEPQ